MELIDFPDEIIIIIVQFIEPEFYYYNYAFRKFGDNQNIFSILFSIYNLVYTCKRFDFLRHKSYLIFNRIKNI